MSWLPDLSEQIREESKKNQGRSKPVITLTELQDPVCRWEKLQKHAVVISDFSGAKTTRFLLGLLRHKVRLKKKSQQDR